MNTMDEDIYKIKANRYHFCFLESVKNAFSFLEESFGFQIMSTEVTFVRYESERMFVNVYHGRISYEIGVEVGCLRADAPERGYRLPDVLGAVLNETHHQNSYYLQASTQENVRSCVETAADLVKQHYGPILGDNAAVWQKIKAFTSKRDEEYTRKGVNQPIRKSAELAWQKKNLSKVAELYASIRADLTPVEEKRLEYAKKQISTHR